MMSRTTSRRGVLTTAAALAAAGAAPRAARAADAAPPQVTIAVIGDINSGLWASLKAGVSGQPLDAQLGTKVVWQPGFTASLPVMEAVRAGGVDFTFATATAVVNAVGANIPIVPLAGFPLPKNEVDLLVAADSPIRGAAGLKGRKVAHQNGTTGTYSLIKYLETAGLRLTDVQAVSLSGADAFTAFAQGSIDAWIHWQPATAIALAKLGSKARTLPGVQTYDYAFYVGHRDFVARFPATAAKLVRAIRDTQRFINAHPQDSVDLWERQGGFAPGSVEKEVYRQLITDRRLSESLVSDLRPVDAAAAASTQDLADSFQALGVLPLKPDVRGFLLSSRFEATRKLVADALVEQV